MRWLFLLGFVMAAAACAPHADSEIEAQEAALPYCTPPGYLPVGIQPCLVPEHGATHVLGIEELVRIYGERIGPDKRVAAVATVRYVSSPLAQERSEDQLAQDILRRMQVRAEPLRQCYAKGADGKRCVEIASEPVAEFCEVIFLCDSEPKAPSLADLDRRDRQVHPRVTVMRLNLDEFCDSAGAAAPGTPVGDPDGPPDSLSGEAPAMVFDPHGLLDCPEVNSALVEDLWLFRARPQVLR